MICPLWQDLEIDPLPLSICVWPSRSADSNAYWKVHPFDIKKRSHISHFRWAGLRRLTGKRTVVSAIGSTVTYPGGAKSKPSSSHPWTFKTSNTLKLKHYMLAWTATVHFFLSVPIQLFLSKTPVTFTLTAQSKSPPLSQKYINNWPHPRCAHACLEEVVISH